jgi:hypothetical protein
MYFGLNLHFTQNSYNVLTYGMNTKPAQTKFESMTREQGFKFEWLADKFPNTQDLVYACIGSQFDCVSVQFGLKEDVMDSYFKFKARRESLTYTIKNEISKHEIIHNLPINKLIFKYLIGEFSPEYMLLITHNTDLLLNLYESPNFSWAKDKILKLMKYKFFFNVQKYLPLIEKQ